MNIPLAVLQLIERDTFYTHYGWSPRDLGLAQFDAWDAHHLPLVWQARQAVLERTRDMPPGMVTGEAPWLKSN